MTLLDKAATKLHDDRMEMNVDEVEIFKENTDECIQQIAYHIRDLYKTIERLQGEINSVMRGDGGLP